jgi:hypothetical protein
MAALALVLWLLATVLVAVPVSLLLRGLDDTDLEEPVDPAELDEAMGRHPSRRPKVA